MPNMVTKLSFQKRALLASTCLTVILIIVVFRPLPHLNSQRISVADQPTATYDDHVTSETELQLTGPSLTLDPQTGTRTCSVIKVSMLYGAHKFPQLKDAQNSHRQHSKRWGCGFENLGYDLVSRKLYSKHYFMLSIMLQELSKPVGQRQQWLMWVDADSILLNPALSPDIFLPPDELGDVYALVTADHNGLNDGVFYLRVHASSIDLLTQIVAYPLAHPGEDLGWFGEQAAMANVIKSLQIGKQHDSGIAWLPRTWFNSYQFETGFEGQPGSMLVHFAGLAETRLPHMSNWLQELQQNQAKWEVPMAHTFYQHAIPKFWAEFATNATSRA